LIPPLNENGYLPPGIHPATLDEVVARFGHGSEQRAAQVESLAWLVPLCVRAGIARLLINGSFVSDREEPNDVDCVLLQGPSYSAGSVAAAELARGMPFLEIKIVTREDYEFFAEILFASDRTMIPKGTIEVAL
jgi:hypothetical protein